MRLTLQEKGVDAVLRDTISSYWWTVVSLSCPLSHVNSSFAGFSYIIYISYVRAYLDLDGFGICI